MVGFSPSGVKAHVDWIIASAGVRQGRPAPEERSHERPLAWKVVVHAVRHVAVALQHHVDLLKERRLELRWNESRYEADLEGRQDKGWELH